jgi:hypothetical protein
MFVDLCAIVPATTTIKRSSEIEEKIVTALKGARREISDVRVQFLPDA